MLAMFKMFGKVTASQFGLILLGFGALFSCLNFYPEEWYFSRPVKNFQDFYANVGTEFFGIAITVLIIDELNKRREDEKLKEQLVRELGNPDNGIALRAAGELNARGNLLDGTLMRANLQKSNLDNAVLLEANLKYSDLKYARLKNVKLSGSDISFSNLEQTDLSQANLNQATLIQADLKKSVLYRAELISANLEKSDLEGANLQEAKFNKAILLNTKLSGVFAGLFHSENALECV